MDIHSIIMLVMAFGLVRAMVITVVEVSIVVITQAIMDTSMVVFMGAEVSMVVADFMAVEVMEAIDKIQVL
jgi:hypothetical protein